MYILETHGRPRPAPRKMWTDGLCAPTIIYIVFSLIQVIFDLMNRMTNMAIMKVIVIIMISFLLEVLCKRGFITVAWLIVFIPFIFMSVIVGFLLYIFGLNPETGTISPKPLPAGVSKDKHGNIIVYDPYYNPLKNAVTYKKPNIIVPVPVPYKT